MGAVLIVAGMDKELCRVPGAHTLCCGIGPVEATLATANALATEPGVTAVLNVGIAGAPGFAPGTVVVGSQSIYCDVLDANSTAPRIASLNPSPALVAVARQALPDAVLAPIATTAWVGGGQDHPAEAMEGFGVLRAAAAAGVPALEVRVVSNHPAETDRRRWQIVDALAVVHNVIRVLAPALLNVPSTPVDALQAG